MGLRFQHEKLTSKVKSSVYSLEPIDGSFSHWLPFSPVWSKAELSWFCSCATVASTSIFALACYVNIETQGVRRSPSTTQTQAHVFASHLVQPSIKNMFKHPELGIIFAFHIIYLKNRFQGGKAELANGKIRRECWTLHSIPETKQTHLLVDIHWIAFEPSDLQRNLCVCVLFLE